MPSFLRLEDESRNLQVLDDTPPRVAEKPDACLLMLQRSSQRRLEAPRCT